MVGETKNEKDGVIEFEGKKIYKIVRPADRQEMSLVVQEVQKLNTKYGNKIVVIDRDGNAILLNQTMINKLLARGIDNSEKLKGKTLYFESKSVLVRGTERKMFDIVGVE
jgi:hypothetical protein